MVSPQQRDHIEVMFHSNLSYAEKLLLKQHRRGQLPPGCSASEAQLRPSPGCSASGTQLRIPPGCSAGETLFSIFIIFYNILYIVVFLFIFKS